MVIKNIRLINVYPKIGPIIGTLIIHIAAIDFANLSMVAT